MSQNPPHRELLSKKKIKTKLTHRKRPGALGAKKNVLNILTKCFLKKKMFILTTIKKKMFGRLQKNTAKSEGGEIKREV